MKGRRIAYSAAEWAWLEANRAMIISDYHRAFLLAFQRDEVTAANLHSLRKRKGWKVGRAPGRTKGRLTKYSPAEIAWLRENATLPLEDLHRQFIAEFGRNDVTVAKLVSLRKRMKITTGRDGRFRKGQEPPNKGKPCPAGVGGRSVNAQRTQFKKGQVSGRAVDLYKPIGTEVVRADGYVQRKINDDLPLQARWRFVHLIEWEALNGPIPEGHCLKCLDGDRSNTAPTNWELISRGLLPLLNGGKATSGLAYNDASPEIRPTVLALARVKHQAHQLRRRGGAA